LRATECRHAVNHEHDPRVRGEFCCRTTGFLDGNKAPKLVVADIRSRARVFLASEGYGTILDWEGDCVDRWGIWPSVQGVGESSDDEADDEHSLSSLTDSTRGRAVLDLDGYLDSDPVQSSPLRDRTGPRLSTGLRAYVLTWLWSRRADPDTLDDGIRQIYLNANTQEVNWFLHTCGCGLSTVNGQPAGCVEPSHLVFGPREANSNHEAYHRTLRQLPRSEYTTVLLIMRAYCRDAQHIL
jgi:hypothetical protein